MFRSKIIKIVIISVLIISVSVLPIFALQQSQGSGRYTSPIQFTISYGDGLKNVFELTPSLMYSSDKAFGSYMNTSGGGVSGSYSAWQMQSIGINKISTVNSAIRCNYNLVPTDAALGNEIDMYITSPYGFFNFQKYESPLVQIPSGYTAEISISYTLYRTIASSGETFIHQISDSLTLSGGRSFDLLKNTYLENGATKIVNGNVYITNYSCHIELTKIAGVSLGEPGWYRLNDTLNWDLFPDYYPHPNTQEGVVLDEGYGNCFIAIIDDQFNLRYIPLYSIKFWIGNFVGDTSSSSRVPFDEMDMTYFSDWWSDATGLVVYDFVSDTWYVPDVESPEQPGDGVITGITPITIRYLHFDSPVQDVLPEGEDTDWFVRWLFDNSTYSPSNPIVTGYDTLIDSEWYLDDVVDLHYVNQFYDSFKNLSTDSYGDVVKIPLNFKVGTPLADAGGNEFYIFDGIYLYPEVFGDTDEIWWYNVVLVDDQDREIELGEIDASGGTSWSSSRITLLDEPSPLAYQWLHIFADVLDMPNGIVDTYDNLDYRDSSFKMSVRYSLENDNVLNQQFSGSLSDVYNKGYRDGFGSGGGSFTGDYGSWLVHAVGGFLDFELFPGFSISGILGIVMAIALVIAFLKFFAGG